jgi:hypothetical protein
MESFQPDSDRHPAARTTDTAELPVVVPPPAGPANGGRYPRWQIVAIATGMVAVLAGGAAIASVMSGKDGGDAGSDVAAVTASAAPATSAAPSAASASASPSPSTSIASPSAKAKASASATPGRGTAVTSVAGFPGVTNTGVPAGVTLRKKSGVLKITKRGTVVDGIDLTGCISVSASNVTIKRSKISGSCAEGTIGPAYNADFTNLVIEDVEIDGLNESTSYSVIGGADFTCRRCNLHGGGTGIRAGSNTVVEDSWLHGNHVGGESHNTAMSIHGGSNITIRHNWLQCDGGWNCSSALSLYTPDGPIDHVLVENNLFSGGGYCVYAGVYNRDGGIVAATYVRFLNNGFLTNQWPKCGDLGPVAGWEAPAEGNQWSGNYWYPNRKKVVEP